MIKTPLSTMIGGAFWTPNCTIIGGTSKTFDQLIKSLFANNEQGFAYDPNDLGTMFQDAAGTIPVTTAGQPVGLVLDKSKGLVLGGELIVNGGFDSPTGWLNPYGFSISSGKLYSTGITNHYISRNDFSVVAGRFYKVVVDISSYTAGMPRISVGGNAIDLGIGVGTKTLYVQALSTTSMLYIYSGYKDIGGTWEMESISIKELAGNHAYQTTSAARPILQRNATTGAYYLAFDGIDDGYLTNSVNLTNTDKVTIIAAVRKLSDAVSYGCVVGFGRSFDQNGTFLIVAPSASANKGFGAEYRAIGGSAAPQVNNKLAPFNAVITSNCDISAKSVSLKINETKSVAALNATGSFSNFPIAIGRREGTSLPFNGHIYGLIGVGRLTTDDETAAIEKELAKRLGATLNV